MCNFLTETILGGPSRRPRGEGAADQPGAGAAEHAGGPQQQGGQRQGGEPEAQIRKSGKSTILIQDLSIGNHINRSNMGV